MSYPEPIPGESAESLYKQAIFFWQEYERVKGELETLKQVLDKIREARGPCDFVWDVEYGEYGSIVSSGWYCRNHEDSDFDPLCALLSKTTKG